MGRVGEREKKGEMGGERWERREREKGRKGC